MVNWQDKFKEHLKTLFDPNQPRDEKGRWASGGSGGGVNGMIDATKKYIAEKGYPDSHVYTDRDARTVTATRSTKELKQAVGDPIATKEIWGKDHAFLDPRVLKDYLEDKAQPREALSGVLKREIREAPSKSIKLRDITHAQEFVFTKPLKKYVKNKNYRSDDLYVIRYNGKYYLNDNNHRVAAAKINGEESLNFKVIDIK